VGRPQGASAETPQPARRQFVKFSFYKATSSWRDLPPDERGRAKLELCDAVESFGDRMLIGTYSLVGLRADADFLVWQIADSLEPFQALASAVMSTGVAPHLEMTHSFLSMTRRSIYKTPQERDGESRLAITPSDARYLFVYPFVKTRPWYELPKDVRQEMMDDHINIGRKYPTVKLNTTYSYGLDDQEFVLAFETDSPQDFLDLVMELRETRASSYTLRDTPIFSCVLMQLPEVLDTLGAPGDVRTGSDGRSNSDAASEWTPVAEATAVPEGSATVVYFQGEQVALFRADGQLYAVDNRCSHANGPLSEGRIEGCAVTCPWHDSQFDLRTGAALKPPAVRPVATYRVRVDGGNVYLARSPVAERA
jgi:chlorite dismutase